MSNPHKDRKIDSYFQKETNGVIRPHSSKTTNAREYNCSRCGKPIENDHSVKYMLCSDCFSSMFQDKDEKDERERQAARRPRKGKR